MMMSIGFVLTTTLNYLEDHFGEELTKKRFENGLLFEGILWLFRKFEN
jgi:hypothetical protein